MADRYLKIGSFYITSGSSLLVVSEDVPDVPPLEIGVPGAPETLTLARGVADSFTATVSGGTGPYTWALVAPNNTLPAGLSLNASTGVVSGTPTTAGSTNIVLRATDSLSATGTSGTITITVTEVADLAIATSPTMPRGEVGAAYTRTLQTTGGYGTKTWAVTSGSVPDGITLSVSGVLSGTPTTAASFTFTAQATDSEARTASRTFSVTIAAAGTVEGPHDYFEFWQSQPEHHYSNSLRTLPEIQSAYTASLASTFWTYDADMDAVKYTTANYGTIKNDGTVNTSWNCAGGQLKIPCNNPTLLNDRIVFVIDWYWPVEFKTLCGTVTNFKTFQVRPNGSGWWTLMNNQGTARGMDANVGFTVTDEFRAPKGGNTGAPDGYHPSSPERVHPAGPGTVVDPINNLYYQLDYRKSYPVDHSVWHRIIVEIRLFQQPSTFTDWSNAYLGGATLGANPHDPAGAWHMVSKWYMSETQSPQRVIYRVPFGWPMNADGTTPYRGPIKDLLFEMNSSKTGALGPVNGWGRNVLILKDMYADEEDTRLFKRPVR